FKKKVDAETEKKTGEKGQKLSAVFVKAFTDTYGGTKPTEALCALGANQCRAPELTEDLIKDGYANTKNWAIGVGYDQNPWWWYKLLIATFVWGGGFAVVGLTWSSTSKYNMTDWAAGNAFSGERLWFDMLDNANTFAGPVYFPFTWLASPPVIFDGVFG